MALDRLAPDDPDRALVLATLCAELTYGSPLERRQALADEAIAIARSSGDDATIVRVLNTVCVPARAFRNCSSSRWIGRPRLWFGPSGSATPSCCSGPRGRRASAAARTLDIDEMDRCLDIIGSLAEQLDQPMLNWVHSCGACRASADRRGHRPGRTVGHRSTPDRHRQRPTRRHLFYGTQLGPVSFQRGTYGELAPLIEQMAVDTPDLAGIIVAALALAHVEAGRIDDARRLLEQVAAADFDFPLDGNWLSTLAYYAEAAIACRDPKVRRTLFDRLAPCADQLPHPRPHR